MEILIEALAPIRFRINELQFLNYTRFKRVYKQSYPD